MRQKVQKVKAIHISSDTYRELKGARKHLNNRYTEGEIVDMLVLKVLPYFLERLEE